MLIVPKMSPKPKPKNIWTAIIKKNIRKLEKVSADGSPQNKRAIKKIMNVITKLKRHFKVTISGSVSNGNAVFFIMFA
jgi:hypothetical protein